MAPTKRQLQLTCPYCKPARIAKEKSRVTIGDEIWIDLECGHTYIKSALVAEKVSIVSKDGRSPFPFQFTDEGFFIDANGQELRDSVHFLEDADCNGLCLHEQGLGKTVIECMLLKRNPGLLPALIVVKSGLRAQWFAEVLRWTGMIPQVISSSRELPLFDLFDIFIVSIDTLRLLRPDVKAANVMDEALDELFKNRTDESKMTKAEKKRREKEKVIWTDDICAKFKHIAVDESQKIKNEDSTRTKALRKIASLANDGQKARTICYSGTNIEKHAGEFFVTLNLARPELFPQKAGFIMTHVATDPTTGKLAGLRNPSRFRDITKDFITRFTRDQVLPDLPKIWRQFRLAEIGGSELEAYKKIVKEFMEATEDPEVNLSQAQILGYLAKMRHITGIAKVDAALEFVEEFLLESERKLVIFAHHIQAREILFAKISKLCTEGAMNQPLILGGGLKLGEGSAIIEEFRKPGNRILVASEMASAEGYNMQFCSDALFLERQFNPSIEEQCEGRFPRPRPDDPWPVGFKINCHYLIAAGTVDDFLTELIEKKRANVANTLDGKEIIWDQQDLMRDLAGALMSRGLLKWRLT